MMELFAVLLPYCFLLDKYLNYLEKMGAFLKKSLIYF